MSSSTIYDLAASFTMRAQPWPCCTWLLSLAGSRPSCSLDRRSCPASSYWSERPFARHVQGWVGRACRAPTRSCRARGPPLPCCVC
eukprot:scaffold3433_cov62-Phaeocystis_antarctica.AAC.5